MLRNCIVCITRQDFSGSGSDRDRTDFLLLAKQTCTHLHLRPKAVPAGLEPATSGVTDRHSNQLSYETITLHLSFQTQVNLIGMPTHVKLVGNLVTKHAH
jgi:hypothetical protein